MQQQRTGYVFHRTLVLDYYELQSLEVYVQKINRIDLPV